MKTKVSIIIPARNEERFIGQCIASIQGLDYPQELIEVIVVDNGSMDQTVAIARQNKVKVFIKSEDGCNVSQLRNFGAKMASHPVLAFVDADCSVAKHWLREAMGFLNFKGVGGVGCWYKLPANQTTWVDSVWDLHMMGRRNTVGEVNWVPSGNFIVRRDIFDQINGFDESLVTSEDVDICHRIRSLGLCIYSHPNLAIEHLGEPNSIPKYFKKESWRGKGVFQDFLRNLPRLKVNKALLLAFLTLALCLGVVVGLAVGFAAGNMNILIISTSLLILMPLILSVKTLIEKKQQWKYLVPLAFLFLLYSIARATSLCEPRIWAVTSNP